MSDETASQSSARAQHRLEQRRRFLKQAGAALGISAGAAWVGLAPEGWPLSIRDPDGERGKPAPDTVKLPEGGFAVDPSESAAYMGVARGQNTTAMVRAAVDAIGGMSRFVGNDDVVVIKPNVAFERAAALGATTSPDVVSALVHLATEAGAREVRVLDNPIESPESCFERSGIRKAAVEAGARVFLPTPNDFRVLHTPGAALIERWPFFWRPFVGATKVIGVAPCKDHNLCGASMTTKNWYGLLGGRRNQFHQDIHGIIADLAMMMTPTFVVLDGVRVLHRSGPTGGSLSDVKPGQTIAASTDPIAVDAFGWEDLLDRGQPVPEYLTKSGSRKLGNPDWRSTNVKEVQVG
jgi:uncharacterized protein (DUF362 family)